MPLESHSLIMEFPEYRNRIHELKAKDRHFLRLFNDYDGLEHEVHCIESGATAASDARLEDLKKKRLVLKDKIFRMLNAA